VIKPEAAAERFELARGAFALPGGLLWLEPSRTLVAADAHLAYEDVIGGALPLWSTGESVDGLLAAIERVRARELVLLGDIVHGAWMSEGAARVVTSSLERLRAACAVTLVAGNHEGRTRAAAVLGETVDAVERDGWTLVHGDRYVTRGRTVIGHLHPSLPVGGNARVPAFLGSDELIVVPALTPYSTGLSVLSRDCRDALAPLCRDVDACVVVACVAERVYPFGSMRALRPLLRPASPATYPRRSRPR
jgi:metallophosphoesterase superfamily enzyme